MKHRRSPTLHSTLLACCLAAAWPAAHAVENDTSTTTAPATSSTSTGTTTTSTTSTTTTAVGTSATTEAKLSAEFAEFLGGKEEAAAVVSGLRQGTAFSLEPASDTTATSETGSTSTPSNTSTTTASSATIEPPTKPMGYGNVRITLRLAQAQLSKLGITQPTTEELSAVLLGGELNGTQMDGILTLRADGMGWGQIAKEYGMTVGQIMGKGAGLTQQTTAAGTAAQTKTTGKASQTSQARSNGYIPSGARSASAPTRSNGYIPSGNGKSHGGGITTAAGGSLGAAAQGNGKGQAHKLTSSTQGAGVVSAGGQQVSMAGASSAGGGKSTAPGQVRKN